MVRKRSRTSRKHYESDENDTDSDISLDDSPAEPAPKKYSLRQRKRSLFLADFEYEDDEDIPPPKPESDEDFDVESELVVTEPSPSPHRRRNNIVYVHEPEPSFPEDELIDFEDVIRADIVVNRNRIDYDNLISKSEIKVQPPGSEPPRPVKGKRGRKPKIRPEVEVDSSILEPETEVQEEYDDLNDADYNPQEDLAIENEAISFVNTGLPDESDKQLSGDLEENYLDEAEEVNELGEPVDPISNLQCENSMDQPDSTSVRDHLDRDPIDIHRESTSPTENSNGQKTSQESVIKFNEKALQVNGNNYHIEQPELHLEFKQECTDEDDDVVFIEDKDSEVIVLDD